MKADTIKIHIKQTLPDGSQGPEATLTLAQKLEGLLKRGYNRDDIFGLAIPLLMQGKLRIDFGDRVERIEIRESNERLQRSAAIEVFESFMAARRSPARPATSDVADPAASPAASPPPSPGTSFPTTQVTIK